MRSDGEYTATGPENELNALPLESKTLRLTHQHLQTQAAGLFQGSNTASKSNGSGKTPMERFLAEGYSQGRGAILDRTPRASGLEPGFDVKDKSPMIRTHK
jgi:hypothetical protein